MGKAGDADILFIGNEAIMRGDVNETQLVWYIQYVKSNVPNLPVTTAEPEEVWLAQTNLIDAVDIISVNIYPYWDGVTIADCRYEFYSKISRDRGYIRG